VKLSVGTDVELTAEARVVFNSGPETEAAPMLPEKYVRNTSKYVKIRQIASKIPSMTQSVPPTSCESTLIVSPLTLNVFLDIWTPWIVSVPPVAVKTYDFQNKK
jgi:hypothetical protein